MPEDDRSRYRAPVGTHDVLPPESDRWIHAVSAFAERAERFAYGLVVTPVLEHVEVFQRIGDSTDVVRKEMYELTDRSDRRLALRPEGTAPVVRAYVEHRPTPPWKVWYVAPNFRYERPQKGRYRQHWQLGAEVLGVDDPAVDVEIISLAHGYYRDLGIRRVRLLLNSMGGPDDRQRYVDVLRRYLLGHAAPFGDTFRERAEQHPLRLLDSKNEEWQDVIERAPQLTEYLSDAAREHFEAVQEGLEALGIAFELAPRLVRGFDYYTSTTFEFASDALDAAQNAIGGGGRYDQLAEQMGGPPTAGIGFGIGLERMMLALDAEVDRVGESFAGTRARLDAFVVDGLGASSATVLLSELRESGLRADRAYGDHSIKTQMKLANRADAEYAVILGRKEAERDMVAVKNLATSEQIEVHREQIAGWLRERRESER
ncbi:MAG: histidine--tRNA ligase [Acidimicrobiia bacterium]